MKALWSTAFIIAIMLSLITSCVADNESKKSTNYEALLKQRLSYLESDVSEIAWVEYESNDVYIYWKTIPDDFAVINRAAALHGSNAINFGCHVWSIMASSGPGWRPGKGPYICETTARYGKVEDSSCN